VGFLAPQGGVGGLICEAVRESCEVRESREVRESCEAVRESCEAVGTADVVR
jgi:hypothetical protein